MFLTCAQNNHHNVTCINRKQKITSAILLAKHDKNTSISETMTVSNIQFHQVSNSSTHNKIYIVMQLSIPHYWSCPSVRPSVPMCTIHGNNMNKHTDILHNNENVKINEY